MSAELVRLFDYDLWANRAWLGYLSARGWPDTETAVLGHVLAASAVWLSRLEGESPAAMPMPAVDEATLAALHGRWTGELARRALTEVVNYRRFNGDRTESEVGDIARHVVNHGTYHRGELRGLCRACGDESFPETDYIRFTSR